MITVFSGRRQVNKTQADLVWFLMEGERERERERYKKFLNASESVTQIVCYCIESKSI